MILKIIMITGLLSQSSFASFVYDYSFERLSADTQLQNSFAEMGYTSIESASRAFEDASETIESLGLDMDLGTLAVCGVVDERLIKWGFAIGSCLTFSHSYNYSMQGKGLTVKFLAGLGALYFNTSTPDKKAHCFKGVSGAVALWWGAQAKALREVSCKADIESKSEGYLVALDPSVGLAIDLSQVQVKLDRVK